MLTLTLITVSRAIVPERTKKDTKGKMYLRHLLDRNRRKMAVLGH
jgi:hypothetical protein